MWRGLPAHQLSQNYSMNLTERFDRKIQPLGSPQGAQPQEEKFQAVLKAKEEGDCPWVTGVAELLVHSDIGRKPKTGNGRKSIVQALRQPREEAQE